MKKETYEKKSIQLFAPIKEDITEMVKCYEQMGWALESYERFVNVPNPTVVQLTFTRETIQ